MTAAHVVPGAQITLRDGRRLGYAEQGDPSGIPVLLFHGNPGSRALLHPDASIAASLGARVIAVDRPGFGLSDFQPGRRLLDWPDDVIQLADALGLGRFAIIGSSAGGPYAAACAYRISERLAATVLASAAGEFGAPGAMDGVARQLKPVFNIARRLPWQFTWWLTMGPMGMMAKKDPEKIVQITVDSFPPSDRGPMLEMPGMLDMIRAAYIEMFRQGARGPALDLALVAKPWGFRMADIQAPVILWHGEDDTNVPLATARRHAAELPSCEAHFVPGIGHALIFSHWRKILAAVVLAARG